MNPLHPKKHTHGISRHSHNLRVVDLWMLPLTLHSPTALLAASFGNVSSSAAIFEAVRGMGKLDTVFKWLLMPSYPLLVVAWDLLPQSKYFWILVAHFGVNFLSELLLVTQLLLSYFIIEKHKPTIRNVLDQCIDHLLARLPHAVLAFVFSYFCFYCLWHMLPHYLIRAPM